MAIYQRTVDYCPDDSVQTVPKYHRDYVPEGVDPITLKTLPSDKPIADDVHDISEPVEKPKITGYKCNRCDYECDTERGMKTHIGRAHKE